MVVGSVLSVTQTDIKRLLAYSSIAHAGLHPRRRPRLRPGRRLGVMFYLVGLRLRTIAAFAVVSLVRQTAAPRPRTCRSGPAWASATPWSPAIFAFLLLAFAGIPLTSGFTAKYAVFAAGGRRRRRLAVLVVVGVLVQRHHRLRLRPRSSC